MIYVVLGMHKSGTTLVSQICHRSGIKMGAYFDTEVDYDAGNHYENLAVQQLNMSILASNRMESLEVKMPKGVTLEPQQQQRILAIIQDNEAGNKDWGFKDPRTCLTYSLWKEHLPEHKLIVVYRHPFQVLRRYRAVRGRRYQLIVIRKLLRAWVTYNSEIIQIIKQTPEKYIIISYNKLMSGQQELARLAAFTGRELVDVRDTSKYRSRSQGSLWFNLMDKLLAVVGSPRPSKIMAELEQLRLQQTAMPSER